MSVLGAREAVASAAQPQQTPIANADTDPPAGVSAVEPVDPVLMGYLYEAGFGRLPDVAGSADGAPAGLEFWVEQNRNGMPLEEIADFFFRVPEFEARAADFEARTGEDIQTAAGLVKFLYFDNLGRAGDPDGLNFWTGLLATREITPAELLIEFARSAETRRYAPEVAEQLVEVSPGLFAFEGDPIPATELGDKRRGSGEDDVLSGLGGDDVLDGGAGNDTLDGGDGDDILTAGTGDDAVIGGDGMDRAVLSFARDAYSTEPLETGGLRLAAAGETVVLDEVELVTFADETVPVEALLVPVQRLVQGTPVNDILEGTDDGEAIMGLAGRDTILGGGGDDTLDGGEGDDRLEGGLGDDRLIASPGEDTLVGGPGADTFVFDATASSLFTGIDRVLDLSPSEDRFELVDFDIESRSDIVRQRDRDGFALEDELPGPITLAPEAIVITPAQKASVTFGLGTAPEDYAEIALVEIRTDFTTVRVSPSDAPALIGRNVTDVNDFRALTDAALDAAFGPSAFAVTVEADGLGPVIRVAEGTTIASLTASPVVTATPEFASSGAAGAPRGEIFADNQQTSTITGIEVVADLNGDRLVDSGDLRFVVETDNLFAVDLALQHAFDL
ncbi:MAG: DUF4214 domain-containing protein [Pseudomonadota bacterium]